MSDFSEKLTDDLYEDMTPGVSLGSADPSNWVGSDLVMRLQESGNRYMFMDEVSFIGAVPESSISALLEGVGVLGVVWLRRGRRI